MAVAASALLGNRRLDAIRKNDWAYDPIAAARKCLYITGFPGLNAERTANDRDILGEICLIDDAVPPDFP